MFLNDRPIGVPDRDKLSFRPMVDALHAVMLDDGLTGSSAFTIGIFGGWGSGKSSLMKLLKNRLDMYPHKFVTMEFNAWRFEEEERLFAPFILSLASVAPEDSDALKRALRIAANTIEGMVNIAIARYTEGILSLREINRVARHLMGKPERNELQRYMDDIERLVQAVTEGGRKTLVVFIDDLDRCHPPEKGIELLEDIKLLMDLPDVAFVLGVDHRALEAIVSKFYGSPEAGRDYLEKFIQLPIYLPPHQTSRLIDMIDGSTEKQPPPEIRELTFSRNELAFSGNIFSDLRELVVSMLKMLYRAITYPMGTHRKLKKLSRLLRKTEKFANEVEDRLSGDEASMFRELRYVASKLLQTFRLRYEQDDEEIKVKLKKIVRELRKNRRWLIKHGMSAREIDELIRYFEEFAQKSPEPSNEPGEILAKVKEIARRANSEMEQWLNSSIIRKTAETFENNPRRFKRFWNLFAFEILVFSARNVLDTVNPELLAKWITVFLMEPAFIEMDHIFEIFDVEKEANLSLNGFERSLKERFDRWGVRLNPSKLSSLMRFLKCNKYPAFSGLEEVMSYAFPHEEKGSDLMAQLIEKIALMGKKYPEWKFQKPIDLSDRYLENGYFEKWFFKGGAKFKGASLQNANFRGIRVGIGKDKEIDFTGAHLEGADLTGADLRPGAIFKNANLQNVKFEGVTFGEVDFENADIRGADFTDVTLPVGRCICLHRARNRYDIVVRDKETIQKLIDNHRIGISQAPDDEKEEINKFIGFLQAKRIELDKMSSK